MRKIIIDTDPGIDDAYAMIAAMSCKDFEILGVCSVAGNKSIELTTTNSQKIVEFMKCKTKVHPGEVNPIDTYNRDHYAPADEADENVHGKDGLGDAGLLYSNESLSNVNAVDFIIEMANKYPGELELITLGPLTNVANAILRDRKAMEGIKSVYSMGGGVKRGNMTPVAEFNYWFDPKAVEILYSIGTKVNIYMIGLDITHKCIFNFDDIFFFKEELGDKGKLLANMADVYCKTYWRRQHYKGCVIHDLLTVLYAIDNSICEETPKVNLRVSLDGPSTGQTVVDLVDSWHLDKNAFVPMTVDARKAKELFIELLDPNKLELYKKFI